MVVPDVMKIDVPENFVLISQLEVCQEGGDKKWGTWRTLRVPSLAFCFAGLNFVLLISFDGLGN